MSTKVNLNEIDVNKNFILKNQEHAQYPNFRANDYERNPDSDKLEIKDKKNNATKWTIGTIVATSVIGLGILGRKGKLGPYIQQLLGGAKRNNGIKDTLESLLEKHKGKKLKELTVEERNKFIDALNPDNKPEIRQKIEAEFEQMQDKSVSEAVDSAKSKLCDINTQGVNPDKTQDAVDSTGKKTELVEEPQQVENQKEVTDTPKNNKKKKVSSGGGGGSRNRDIHTGDKRTNIDGLSEIDRRNNAWLEEQHAIKEKDYDEFWQNALKEQDEQLDNEFEEIVDKYLEQISKNPKFSERDTAEVAQELTDKIAEYFKSLNTRTMSDERRIGAFFAAIRPQMKEQDIEALINHFGLSSVFEKTKGKIHYNGQEYKTLSQLNENMYMLSDGRVLDLESNRIVHFSEYMGENLIPAIKEAQGEARVQELSRQLDGRTSVRVNDQKSEELQNLAEYFQAEAEAAEAAKAKRIQDGRELYEELNQTLDGRVSVRVSHKKNDELERLGEYYKTRELQSERVLKQRLAAQSEKMRWFDAYLRDEDIRRVLRVADNAEISFANDVPYTRNQSGNIVTYNRHNGIWTEWTEEWLETRSGKISETKQNDGMVWTRRKNSTNGTYDYASYDIKTGEEDSLIGNRLVDHNENGEMVIRDLSYEEEKEFRRTLSDIFGDAEPVPPKHFPYGDPKDFPKNYVRVRKGKSIKDIEAYVASFPPGTFVKVNKEVVIHEAGQPKTITIIYEGRDFDIDDMGRILPKLKVDPLRVREQRISRPEQTIVRQEFWQRIQLKA